MVGGKNRVMVFIKGWTTLVWIEGWMTLFWIKGWTLWFLRIIGRWSMLVMGFGLWGSLKVG